MEAAPHAVTARRPGESLSRWHARHRPNAEVAWRQIGLLYVTACFGGPVLLVLYQDPGMLLDPDILLGPDMIDFLVIGIFNLLMLAPGMLVALSCDRGPFGWVRGVWAVGSLGLATALLACLGRYGEAVLLGPLGWAAVVFALTRPWRRYQRAARA